MADISASNVTYTVKNLRKGDGSRNKNRIQLAFGNATLTYGTGGIPLTIGKLGCPNTVESLVIVDKSTSGFEFMYDATATAIRMFQSPVRTHTHDLFLKNADQTDGATFRVNATGNKLGANTGTSITVSGITNVTASGGVLQATLAVAALTELSGEAIAAQTITVEVMGW